MLNRMWALIKKEFFSIWRDPKSRTLIIMPPLMQLFIFAHAATMEVKNIHMAILDKNQTLQSRELIKKFENSVWFKQIILVDNENQIEDLIKTRKVEIAMALDSNFSKDILSGKPTNVQIIVDGRQTNIASITNSYVSQILLSYESENFPNRYQSVPRINVEVRNWFNPNLIFLWYTVVSLIGLLACMIALLLTALSIAREREMGTFDQLTVSPLSPFEILIGKTIPPLFFSLIITTIMSCFAVFLFKIPFTGSVLLFYISTIVFLLSMLGIGLFISSICKTQQQAILGAFAFQMPAVLLSGYVSPIEDMPLIFQYMTLIDPIRFYLIILKGTFLKAMSFDDIFHNLIPLMIIGIIALSIAAWMFEKNLD